MAGWFTAFGLGLLATLSPCFLPLYPGFLAYLAAQSTSDEESTRWIQMLLGLLVLAGLISSMLLIGGLITLLDLATGQVLSIVTPIADIIVITLGVPLLLGVDLFRRLPTLALPGAGSPPAQAYWYGVLYGPMLMPCAAPLLISVFTLSLASISISGRLLFMLFFSLGLGLPLSVLSLLSQVGQRWLVSQMRRFFPITGRIAGAVLIIVGTLELVRQWPYVRLYLGI